MPIFDDSNRPSRLRLDDERTPARPAGAARPATDTRRVARPGQIDPTNATPGPFHMLGAADPQLVKALSHFVNENHGPIVHLYNEIQVTVSRFFGRNARLTKEFLAQQKTDPKSEEGQKLIEFAATNDRMSIFFVLLAAADQAARCMPQGDLTAHLSVAHTFIEKVEKLNREGKICQKHGAVMHKKHEKTKIHVCPYCEEYETKKAAITAIGTIDLPGALTPEKLQALVGELVGSLTRDDSKTDMTPEPEGKTDGETPRAD